MINSHYVPQFILRHFSDADRIQYCDLSNRKVETRNIRSTFSEKGYYPDEIEKEMCYKAESQFANLFNNKLLNERRRIILTRDELFTLKKYLIITTIRYNCTEAMKNFGWSDKVVQGYAKNLYDNINKVLACKNADELFKYISVNLSEKRKNRLWFDIKNIVHSYIVFVSTYQCGESFIMPDTGYAYKATPLAMFSNSGFDKCMYTLYHARQTRNPYLFQIYGMLSPYDMIICPVSNDFAIISLSMFFKFFNSKSDVYGFLPIDNLTVEKLLGFGDSNMVEPPKVKYQFDKPTTYEYTIQQLMLKDVLSLNVNMINTAEHYFGYKQLESVRSSIDYYSSFSDTDRRYNLDFIK